MSEEGNLFIMAWDCNGLEAVVNVTDIEKRNVWATLQGAESKSEIGHIVNYLMLRARANGQRHYEIYTITVQDGITDEDLREMFSHNPQAGADLVRERGNKIYSDRYNEGDKIKIV